MEPEFPNSDDDSVTDVTLKRLAVRPLSEGLVRGDAALTGDVWETGPITVVAPKAGGARRVVRAAGVIMVGSLLSSLMGMVRIVVINVLFYGAASGAFIIALRPIQQVSNLLIGGSVSGALIPTFVDYSAKKRREELRQIYSTITIIGLLAMAVAVVALWFLAPVLAPLYLTHGTQAERDLTATFIRVTAFALFGLALYATGSAILYALDDVVSPAFSTFIQHVGVIGVGLIALFYAAAKLGIPVADIFAHGVSATPAQINELQTAGAIGLGVGFVAGALGEAALLLPGLRRARVSLTPVLRLNHRAVRQILRLYLPIAAGLLFSVAQDSVELWLNGRAPGDPSRNVTALQSATTLIQFPTGLVVAALAFSVLPPLTSAASRNDMRAFKRTIIQGCRLGLLLMTPAMVAYLTLGEPIAALLFQHGACHVSCTYLNNLALTNNSYQLPFLAVDQMMIAAFYARKNTITPTVISLVAYGIWAALAVPLSTVVGMPALAFANAALNSSHAIILFVLLTLAIGGLGMRYLWAGVWRIGVASALMGAVIVLLLRFLPTVAPAIFTLGNVRGQLATVFGVGIPAALVYMAVVALLRMDEPRMLVSIVRARLGGARG